MKMEIEDNSGAFIKEKDRKILQVLESWGMTAESFAKSIITAESRVDTGLLRNSITYALWGKEPKISAYKGDSESRYGKKGIPDGEYNGTVPTDKDETVYIGTNVEYAIYNEIGTDRLAGIHFLKNAIVQNQDKYKEIAQKIMKG